MQSLQDAGEPGDALNECAARDAYWSRKSMKHFVNHAACIWRTPPGRLGFWPFRSTRATMASPGPVASLTFYCKHILPTERRPRAHPRIGRESPRDSTSTHQRKEPRRGIGGKRAPVGD